MSFYKFNTVCHLVDGFPSTEQKQHVQIIVSFYNLEMRCLISSLTDGTAIEFDFSKILFDVIGPVVSIKYACADCLNVFETG